MAFFPELFFYQRFVHQKTFPLIKFNIERYRNLYNYGTREILQLKRKLGKRKNRF